MYNFETNHKPMNQREIAVIEYLVGDDIAKRDAAVKVLFFCDKDKPMGRYQRAAHNAIMIRYDDPRYSGFSAFEKYNTVMGVVVFGLIESLRRNKAKFESDPANSGTPWLNDKQNLISYITTCVGNESNRRRPIIDEMFALPPEQVHQCSSDKGGDLPADDETDNPGIDDDTDTSDAGELSEDIQQGNFLGESEQVEIEQEDTGDEAADDDDPELQILTEAVVESLNSLKEKDREILVAIKMNGVSEEDYAKSHGIDINGLYRDVARAVDRLISGMISYIQSSNRSMVCNYGHVLDYEEKQLASDILIRKVSFKDAATSRGIRVSDIQTKFASAYKKLLKESNNYRKESFERIDKEDRRWGKLYARHLKNSETYGII